jgi:predicted transcriptional regulator
MIERMPDNLSEDDVMYALYVRKAVERGIADADAGRFATDEQVKRVLGKWHKSAGL